MSERDDVTAAASRLRRQQMSGGGFVTTDEDQWTRDVCALANAYLATVAADELLAWVRENLAASKRADDGGQWWKGYIGAMHDILNRAKEMSDALQPSGQEHPSRSIQRREAAMRGEEPPEFKPGTNEVIEPSEQEQASSTCAACGGDGYYKGPRLGDEPCPECQGYGTKQQNSDGDRPPPTPRQTK